MGSHKNKKKPSGQKTKPGAKKPVQSGAKAQNAKITQESKKKGKKKILWISLASCASVALIVILAIVLAGGSGDSKKGAFSPSDGIDANGFWEGITALNYVELFDYTALSIPNDVHEISDDALMTAIVDFLDEEGIDYSSIEKQIKDRAVADGDTVNIDYVGSVDGVEFEGGSTGGTGTPVTIGVTSYIDDFLEQLIGHTPGETFNVEVTFPDPYDSNTDLSGKDAVFITTINYIVDGIELTDEFVETNLDDGHDHGWKTANEFKDAKREELQKKALQDYVYEYLTTSVTISSLPDKLIEHQENAMINSYQGYADEYGMEFDEFLSTYLYVANVDELIENYKEDNRKNATFSLVCQAIAEDTGIAVSDEDLEKYIPDYASYEGEYGLPYLKQYALSQKVMDYIIENAVLA